MLSIQLSKVKTLSQHQSFLVEDQQGTCSSSIYIQSAQPSPTFLVGKWYKPRPPLTPLTPNVDIFGMGVEMRFLVRIPPILLFPDRSRVKPYPYNKKRGGWKFAPDGRSAWAYCWASMVHFWKPWKQAFWPSPECREPFSMLPMHALSSTMAWNAGDGPWWAATAETLKNKDQLRF